MYDTLQNLPGLGETIRLTDFDGTELDQMVKFLGGVRHFRLEDIDRAIFPATLYGEKWVTAVLLKNHVGSAVLPKRIYTLKTDGSDAHTLYRMVDAIGTTPYTTRLAIFADPFLPAAGCADAYAFWGIVHGPTIAMTAAAHANAEDLAIGDRVTVANEATGRISGFAAPSTAQNAFDYASAVLGTALEAAPCTATGHQDLDKWVFAAVPWYKG